MSLKDYLADKAKEFLATSRNWWRGFRIGDYDPTKPAYSGFRLARSGKHKDTMLTRHEQTRNPAGTKLWKKCPIKQPCWETGK